MSRNVQARGLKRTCQNAACGSHFYDLQRATFACPICATPFDVARAEAEERPAPARSPSRWPRYGRVAPTVVAEIVAADEVVVEADEFAADGEPVEGLLEAEDDDEAAAPVEFDAEPAKGSE